MKIETASMHRNKENLQILNRVRLIAINGQLALILFSIWFLQIKLPLYWMFGLIGLEVIFQMTSLVRFKRRQSISDNELMIHLVFDSLILAGLVYFSGGANNPFIYLLLLPLALATLMLTPKQLLIIAVLQFSLYSLINLYQRPLALGEFSPLASFHLHLAGMWVNFALTVALIAIFGSLARVALMQQEKKIQQLREKQLKDEQILSLGIISASAAHELGTPLATMAIVVEDLQHEALSNSQLQDMQLLATQISQCRQIIQSLSEKSKSMSVEAQSDSANFVSHLSKMLENWLVFRPQFQLKQQWSEKLSQLKQTLPVSVEQAITNLLDNAAEASLENGRDEVAIKGELSDNNIVIDIIDYGKGISDEMKQSLGVSVLQTDKQRGLGWGVFLSNASIERASGKVQLLNTENGGTLTRINLPLAKVG